MALAIWIKCKIKNKFSFAEVAKKDIEKEILSLKTKKLFKSVIYWQKSLKETLTCWLNLYALLLIFPLNFHLSCLNLLDAIPQHKKWPRNLKQIYKPGSASAISSIKL